MNETAFTDQLKLQRVEHMYIKIQYTCRFKMHFLMCFAGSFKKRTMLKVNFYIATFFRLSW